MEHSDFPSTETLAAFIDGRLDAETRRKVIEHMAGCEECWTIYMAASERPAETSEEAKVVKMPLRFWSAAGVAAAAAIVAGLVLTPMLHRDPLGDLRAAAPAHRTFKGRLTGFSYHPTIPAMRGNGEQKDALNPEFAKVWEPMANLLDRTAKKPTANDLHALGAAYLLTDDFHGAVENLTKAAQLETGETDLKKAIAKSADAALLTDLAAALNEAGSRGDKVQQELALRAAERAWKLHPSPESGWNRALATESLKGCDAALPAWRDYLHLEHDSTWRESAIADRFDCLARAEGKSIAAP